MSIDGRSLRVVLASSSPRRRELLERLGISFDIRPADIDETELPGEDPVTYVRRLALGKAAVGEIADEELLIAADTTIDLDGVILAKPDDPDHARRMLTSMSGRTHLCHTGVAVRHRDRTEVAVATSAVTMVPIDDELMDFYIATGEAMGKAGAYGIQGAAELLIERIDGTTSNIIGLPLAVLDQLVRRFGTSLAALARRGG